MSAPSHLALPTVFLHEASEADWPELLEFETSNRVFFEKWVPARNPGYFAQEPLKLIIQGLVADPDRFYLIRNQHQQLVGRINLRGLGKEPYNSAELGYRVGEQHLGKGYAKAAVLALAKQAREDPVLTQLVAFAADNNPASSTVLQTCGFKQDEAATKTVKLNNVPLTLLHFVLPL
ncbi:ribosomal-protein-S5-alanine N-acetyltransferase [Pseudovibrio axinellae]|uniref:Ribosomal-protein-S5-alanine N-acetyltransferase n=1 Tax=Pseudovibrio axinellae TaxID=989403 RepID=A0A165XQ69_9HYPH|nr:GNAT family N-acetyltransferase [Pseudovibrio axinellae]KZL17935.1 ribosomal-protein-S5-alanine N-acetyltransferase [Pseudovibrio axinellae]SER76755.1 ribosomal-protein-alanine N-acetyltransferase [Pseudovibrio axinellae]